MDETQEKRTPNLRGLLLMITAAILTMLIFAINPGSWQMWAMLGMTFIGFCHFIGALHRHSKWMEERDKKKVE